MPSHYLSPGVVVSLQLVIIQNNPHHMTLINPEREEGGTYINKDMSLLLREKTVLNRPE